MRTTISTVLGDFRTVTKSWDDGSVQCPYCTYPIGPEEVSCPNPWCEAHTAWSPEALARHREEKVREHAARKAEEDRRESIKQAVADRNRVHAEWQAEQIAEAERRGACLTCLFQPGWERTKFVRHRGPCPKQRR